MNSQETLWFIGKCLSLALHPERAGKIQETLQSGKVNWNSLVYHSSNQLVLPALYLNLKRNNLLDFLPEELKEHLEDITNQNRKRNQLILDQVEEITILLKKNGLEPIYLKGTAHLLDGLYEDIAERMLSDIDFLLDEKEANKAWQLLVDSGYQKHNEISVTGFGLHRHLIELIKKGEVASVEVHTRVLEGDYHKKFNYSHIKKVLRSSPTENTLVPSIKHQILHNILNAQKNDKAKSNFKVLLRNSYDLMLLGQQKKPFKVINEFGYYFEDMNSYIGLSAELLAYPKGLEFEKTKKTKRYIKRVNLIWKYPGIINFFNNFIFFRIYRYMSQSFLFFLKSSVRKRILTSLRDPDYLKAHWAMYKKWFS